MSPPSDGGTTTLKFRIATRGLVGLRNNLLTATRGLGQLNTLFMEYGPQVCTHGHKRACVCSLRVCGACLARPDRLTRRARLTPCRCGCSSCFVLCAGPTCAGA